MCGPEDVEEEKNIFFGLEIIISKNKRHAYSLCDDDGGRRYWLAGGPENGTIESITFG